MRARVGDLVIVDGNHIGTGRRTGRIMEVLGSTDRIHFRVGWDAGGDTIYFPQSDCTIVPAESWRPAEDTEAGPVPAPMGPRHGIPALGPTTRVKDCPVELSFEEDDEHTDARATVHMSGFELTGFGRARRNPHDPKMPVVGEELAAARALADLSHQLLDLATYQIEKKEGHAVDIGL